MASYGAQPRERGAVGVKGGLVHMSRMCVAQITPTVALSILSVADPIRFRTACTVVGMLRQYVAFMEMDVVPNDPASREGVLSPVRVHGE